MDDERDPWYAEADAAEYAESDYEVAFAADLPGELAQHGVLADADPGFEVEFDEWLACLSEDKLVLLVLEQCCTEGILLPPDLRGTRLSSAPMEALAKLDLFLVSACPHVVSHLALTVFWLVRAERARRRGRPDWSPQSELPPLVEEHAFFRPSLLRFRR